MPQPAVNAFVSNWTDQTYAQLNSALVASNFAYTALSGGGKTGATPLAGAFNTLSVVAALGDSAMLPAATAPKTVTVYNGGAFPAQIFAVGATDTINNIANAAGVWIGVGATVTFTCTTSGAWIAPQDNLVGTVPVALTTNGAVNPHCQQVYQITKAGVLTETLAAPTAGADDGNIIQIFSNTANAHTLTATSLFCNGGASSPYTTATFAAKLGAGLYLQAYNGTWTVVSSQGITFS